jgi:hypothetical protein
MWVSRITPGRAPRPNTDSAAVLIAAALLPQAVSTSVQVESERTR